jgi:hypothetical protein
VNGNQVMTGDPYGDFVSIPPDHTAVWGAYTPWASNVGFTHYISVGRNQPDGWSTFNGNIGDIFVYKAALTDAERQQLEARLISKFILPPRPTLSIAASGSGSLEITWPDTFTGQLLSSPTLASDVSWTPFGGSPTQSNGFYRLSVVPGATAAFFALGL